MRYSKRNVRASWKGSFKVQIRKEQSYVADYKDKQRNSTYYPFMQTAVIQ